jgi:hypothetical protein
MPDDHEIEIDEVDEEIYQPELATVFDYQIMLIGLIPDLNKLGADIEHLYLKTYVQHTLEKFQSNVLSYVRQIILEMKMKKSVKKIDDEIEMDDEVNEVDERLHRLTLATVLDCQIMLTG